MVCGVCVVCVVCCGVARCVASGMACGGDVARCVVWRGVWRVARGAWRVARGAWRVARGAWRVTRGGGWRLFLGFGFRSQVFGFVFRDFCFMFCVL